MMCGADMPFACAACVFDGVQTKQPLGAAGAACLSNAYALVVFDYDALEPDELTIKEGDVITHITAANHGWCMGVHGGA